ncbi:zinc finger, CCHC-type [Artemisia annua]|uniref:Zinc finger, CCHC-type n=1 Tax=Artemisia annua TaxID=35608 RepID=A0A2U1QCS4_ARTAN|nr:zinc finger, CCHC-type [Artemisia annua]
MASNLRIILKYEEKLGHIETPLPDPPAENATPEQLVAYQNQFVEQKDYVANGSQELYNTQMQLNACKIEERQSLSSHVLKMKSYIDKLEHLGHPMPHVLAVNTILGSLAKSLDNFMQGWDKTLGELHAMLKTADMCLPRTLFQA